MKPRFTFQYLYHLLILNTFHQAQGMKTNSAVSCFFTIDFYQDHFSIVTYLLLNGGRVHISEAKQNIHSYLQQFTAENDRVYQICWESQRRYCCFHSNTVLLSTLSAEVAVNLAHCPCLYVQLYLLLEVNAHALGTVQHWT